VLAGDDLGFDSAGALMVFGAGAESETDGLMTIDSGFAFPAAGFAGGDDLELHTRPQCFSPQVLQTGASIGLR
jgi:hypothetical protein